MSPLDIKFSARERNGDEEITMNVVAGVMPLLLILTNHAIRTPLFAVSSSW